ncbi:MAG: dihydrodipicolinate synthase family protein, partial [Planctomycetota bacterium]
MIDPVQLIRPRRKIEGISAVLLPYTDVGEIDWHAFDSLLTRTLEAGLTPAVNMDTGYVNLLDAQTRRQVLKRTRAVLGEGPFVAGAFVADHPGDSFAFDRYAEEIEAIASAGGTPVIFQSYGLAHQTDEAIIGNYQQIAGACEQ